MPLSIIAHGTAVQPEEPPPPAVWTKCHTKWATGDDRFSFPPVPGYTGYIPRSQDYFGKPYVQTTYAALADFQAHKPTGELSPYLQTAVGRYNRSGGQRRRGGGASDLPPHNAGAWSGCKYYSGSSMSAMASSTTLQGKKPKPFISGYTGFVPQLRSHFGEPYAKSVKNAIEQFHVRRGSAPPGQPGVNHHRSAGSGRAEPPIPGFTGVTRKKVKPELPTLPPKDLSEELPIPGYRGHIPSYVFSSERSYGISATKCLHDFHEKLARNKEAWLKDVMSCRDQT